MKKNIVLLSIALLSIIAISFSGCSKDDATSPVVTLSGNSSVDVPLNSTYTDAGATASDDVDGTLTVTSDESTTNPNVNRAGTYTITYTASDKAGNVGSATRVVRVYNEAERFEGNYNNCVDTCASSPSSPFNSTVTLSDSVNRLVVISNFGALTANIYATITANTVGAGVTITTPQSLVGNALLTSIYTADSKVLSATTSSTSFTVKYVWFDGTASENCTSVYIR